MDYPALDFGIKFVNLAVTIGVGFYVWLTNRNRGRHEGITKVEDETGKSIKSLKDETVKNIEKMKDEVDDRLGQNAAQLARLEEAGKHTPTHDDLKRIHQRIDDVSGSIAHLQGEFSGAKNTLNLIHEYLMKGSK